MKTLKQFDKTITILIDNQKNEISLKWKIETTYYGGILSMNDHTTFKEMIEAIKDCIKHTTAMVSYLEVYPNDYDKIMQEMSETGSGRELLYMPDYLHLLETFPTKDLILKIENI